MAPFNAQGTPGPQRGDIVEYRDWTHANVDNNGSIAIVLGPVAADDWQDEAVFVRLVAYKRGRKDEFKDWYAKPWFNVRNCVVIGHIDE